MEKVDADSLAVLPFLSRSPSLSHDEAQDLLGAFDIADDSDSREFLTNLLTSGKVPQGEIDELRFLSNRSSKGETPENAKPAASSSSGVQEKEQKNGQERTDSNVKTGRNGKGNETNYSKEGVSHFFGNDESPSEHGREGTEMYSPLCPPAISPRPTFTKTVAIITKQTVLTAEPNLPTDQRHFAQPDDGLTDKSKSVSVPLLSPSPPQLAVAAVSPSQKTPQPKRKRATTSHFFTPSSSTSLSRKSSPSSDRSAGDREGDGGDVQTPRNSSRAGHENSLTISFAPKRRRGIVSSIPFAPLTAPRFGLVQEDLAHDPFWLLIALVFLVRVAGRVSLPVFWEVKARYPTPQALADAGPADLVARMRHLGMPSVRCAAIHRYARRWLNQPPRPGVRTPVKGYPMPPEAEELEAAEEHRVLRVADSDWEIGHLTQGAYAIDSWRIFCRDVLLGRSTDWRGANADGSHKHKASRAGSHRADIAFQPEWMRVLPRDKELRACLRWLWMQEGWDWDPLTGDRTVLREELRQAVNEGRVGYNAHGQLQILETKKGGEE